MLFSTVLAAAFFGAALAAPAEADASATDASLKKCSSLAQRKAW
jgi:hypothetical protein